ncbi:hypothetical protein BD777DRAFT_129234 [Yarrowia lipolytica]|nr:hypothetical protein BD777DRAFT_129234 [Yarrowia lipolytica]
MYDTIESVAVRIPGNTCSRLRDQKMVRLYSSCHTSSVEPFRRYRFNASLGPNVQ